MQEILDIFGQRPFETVTLSKHYNKQPYIPGFIGSMGIFQEEGIRTTKVAISYLKGKISLLPWTPRNAPDIALTDNKAKTFDIETAHFPLKRLITPDQIQNIRSYDTPDRLLVAQDVVDQQLKEMSPYHDMTLEYMKLGAVRGKILDADGVTTKVDLFNLFGIAIPDPFSFVLGDALTKVQTKCHQYVRRVRTAMGGTMYGEIHLMCGPDFFDALIGHDSVRAAYANAVSNGFLRDNHSDGGFYFGGIYFHEYFGGLDAAGNPFVAPAEAHPIVKGVPGMYCTNFAPMNSTDWANQKGLPKYASIERLKHGRGIEVVSESDPLAWCAYPEAVIKATM
jgi:hypothetical protein